MKNLRKFENFINENVGDKIKTLPRKIKIVRTQEQKLEILNKILREYGINSYNEYLNLKKDYPNLKCLSQLDDIIKAKKRTKFYLYIKKKIKMND